MTDRELLELAAKAAIVAGVPVVPHANRKILPHLMFALEGREWNPLANDGDALRLAVKLRINLWIEKTIVIAEICSDDEGPNIIAKELDSSEAATRRAIVRAAAEIGKGMA